jgi:hypothetical protein
MQQIARNVTMDGCGALRDCLYLLHDRDAKSSGAFPFDHRDSSRQDIGLMRNDGSDRLRRNVDRRSFSSANARCVGRCKSMLHTTIVSGTIQRKPNVLLFPRITETREQEAVRCLERLGGLLRYDHQDAA